MLPIILKGIDLALIHARRNSKKVGEQSGDSAEVVERVLGGVEAVLKHDEQALHQTINEQQLAREFAVAMKVNQPVVDVVRGLVRPVITYTAMAWYVWARVNGASLAPEDYAIIGGIIAFWFGFRPFEKRGH